MLIVISDSHYQRILKWPLETQTGKQAKELVSPEKLNKEHFKQNMKSLNISPDKNKQKKKNKTKTNKKQHAHS